jgi:hypothetical protein
MMTGVNFSMDVESQREISAAVRKWKRGLVSICFVRGLVLKRASRDGER